MKKNRNIIAALGLTISLGIAGATWAQSGQENGKGMPPPPPPHGGLSPFALDRLNLSDEQKTQIKSLLDKSRADSDAFLAKMRETEDALRTSVKNSNFNEAQARELVNAKAAADVELQLIRLKTDAAIYNLLTAEQKTQFEQLEQSRPERGGRRGGFRPEPRPQN